MYLKIWKGNVKCTNLFDYQIILLLVKYCLDIVYDTFFYESAFLLLYISALLSACLQKISEADSASKWVEIFSEVQRIEFSLNTNSPFRWCM